MPETQNLRVLIYSFFNIFLKNISVVTDFIWVSKLQVPLVRSLPSICHLTPPPSSSSSSQWVTGQPEAQQMPSALGLLTVTNLKAACMKNRNKNKQKVIEERRLASPNNYHDIRQMELGSRRAVAKRAGCGEAARPTS